MRDKEEVEMELDRLAGEYRLDPTVSSRWEGEELIWTINGEDISDRALRSWCYHNVEGVMRYVDVVRDLHVRAWANRNRSSTRSKT